MNCPWTYATAAILIVLYYLIDNSFGKLQVADRAQAIVRARQAGLE